LPSWVSGVLNGLQVVQPGGGEPAAAGPSKDGFDKNCACKFAENKEIITASLQSRVIIQHSRSFPAQQSLSSVVYHRYT
jgi:hypothetical protein